MRSLSASVSALILTASVATLWSCSSGDSNQEASPLPPPASAAVDVVAIGTVTGFGSVYVNGVRYATTNTEVTIDDEPATVSALKLGQVVELLGKAHGESRSADVIRYHDNLEGPVSAVDVPSSAFVAMGQTVLVTSATTIGDGIVPPSIEGLDVGDVVEVSGLVDADGDIAATRVEIRQDNGPYDVTGPVSGLDLTRHIFSVNALVVDYSSANMLDFPGGAPAAGDLVLVKGFTFAADGTFVATRVELRSDDWLRLGDAGEVEIEGLITSFASATSFDVADHPVTTTAATLYEHGTAANLALGVKVEVEGKPDTAGVLVAAKVKFLQTSAIRVMAPLSAVSTDRSTLSALGLEIAIDESTRFSDRVVTPVTTIMLRDLAVGDWVDVRGYEDPAGSNSVTATRVERIAAEDEVRLRGPFREPARPAFRILSVNVLTVEGLTRYVLEEGIRLSADQFFAEADGELVETWGSWTAPTLTATRVEIKVVDD